MGLNLEYKASTEYISTNPKNSKEKDVRTGFSFLSNQSINKWPCYSRPTVPISYTILQMEGFIFLH